MLLLGVFLISEIIKFRKKKICVIVVFIFIFCEIELFCSSVVEIKDEFLVDC